MEKKAIVLLAEGFEEVEAITPIDYLRRAGIEIISAAVGDKSAGTCIVKGARDISVLADISLEEWLQKEKAVSCDAVVLPGGMLGASNLAACDDVNRLLKEMAVAGKLICAICAAPAIVLAPLGLLKGRRFTCYPGMEDKVQGGRWTEGRVVVDDNLPCSIITSRSAGCAGSFAIAIISKLMGEAEGLSVAQSVLL